MANNKCLACGGNLEKIDAETFVCDSCGTQITLAELNNSRARQYVSANRKNNEYSMEQKRNSALTDKKFLPQVNDIDLLRQIDLALKIKNWVQASRIANEMLRRDPCNANAYLYKMLAVLEVQKKEDLKNLDASLDRIYDDYDEIYDYYDDYEEEHYYDDEDDEDYDEYISYDGVKGLKDANYYHLFLEFADENLKQEIENYNAIIRNRLEQQHIEREKRREQERIERQERWELEKLERQEKLHNKEKENRKIALRNRCKLLLKILIPILIIISIVIGIVMFVKNDKIKYSSDNFNIEATDKINVTRSIGGINSHEFLFKFKITNNSKLDINSLCGYMTVKDKDENILCESSIEFFDYSPNGLLASGAIGDFKDGIQIWHSNYSYDPEDKDEGAILWELSFDELNIYFQITSISFSNGRTEYYYNNGNIKIKSAKLD